MPYIRPMLATLTGEPFDRPGWVFEEKYDGIRIVAERKKGAIRLYTRNLIEREIPPLADEIAKLPGGDLVLDGELFHRGGTLRYAAFDCLVKDGAPLMKRPLRERRQALEEIVKKNQGDRREHRGARLVMVSRRLTGGGLAAYALAVKEQWEGIIAKDEASLYEPGKRTRAWLKVKVVQEVELVIGGYTPPSGSRAHFGALLIGVKSGKQIRFAGKVGSGFDAKSLAALKGRMDRLRVEGAPFLDAPRLRKAVWVKPELVCRVRFMEWTGDGKLRHPVFVGLVT